VRARASKVGQLLVLFAVCAGLIGVPAAFGYAALTRQDATAKQLIVQDHLGTAALGVALLLALAGSARCGPSPGRCMP